jgi:hypothetical protein
MNFPPTQGFGLTGLPVTETGVVHRFRTPVRKVVLINYGDADVYVGINAIIAEAATDNGNSASEAGWMHDRRLEALTAAEAIAKGVLLPADERIELEACDVMPGGGNIYGIWAITAAGEATTVQGGATSY